MERHGRPPSTTTFRRPSEPGRLRVCRRGRRVACRSLSGATVRCCLGAVFIYNSHPSSLEPERALPLGFVFPSPFSSSPLDAAARRDDSTVAAGGWRVAVAVRPATRRGGQALAGAWRDRAPRRRRRRRAGYFASPMRSPPASADDNASSFRMWPVWRLFNCTGVGSPKRRT